LLGSPQQLLELLEKGIFIDVSDRRVEKLLKFLHQIALVDIGLLLVGPIGACGFEQIIHIIFEGVFFLYFHDRLSKDSKQVSRQLLL
jgi:hypothetical protein